MQQPQAPGQMSRPVANQPVVQQQPQKKRSVLGDVVDFTTKVNNATYGTGLNVAKGIANAAPEFILKGSDGKNLGDNVADMVAGNTARIVNTGYQGVVKPIASAVSGKSEQQIRADMDKGLYSDRGGLLNAGTVFKTKQQYEDTMKNPLNFLKGFTGAGVGAATEIAPVMRGASLLSKPGLTTGQKVVRGGLEGAGYGAVGTAAQQAVEQRDFNAKEIAQGAVVGGVMGGGIPAIPAVAKATKNAGIKRPTNLDDFEIAAAMKVRDANAGMISNQDISLTDTVLYNRAVKKVGGQVGTPEGHQALINALDAHRDYDTKLQIRDQQWTAANEFAKRRLVPGGTLGGPLATGYKDAQKAGLVFDGVDGKPRFEVDDSGAKLNNEQFDWGLKMDGKPRKVGQILEHDKLFEQYPELKDVNVRYEPNDLPGHDAHFDPDTNTIVITKSRADKSHLSDIIHELQHSIQEREGFAGGGAPEYRNYKAENASIKRGLQDVNTTLSGKNLTPEQTQRLRAKRDNLIKQLEETQDQYGNVYTKAKDIAEYRRLAGEAEARAVQARMNMPMSERYVKPQVDPSKAPEKWKGLINDSRQYTNPDDFVKSKQMDYHGTEQNFKRFANSAIGSRGEPGFAGKGFYFTNRKNYAREYGKNVMEAHLNIKNPYVLDNAPGGFGVPYSPDLIKERLKLPSDATPADITKKLKDMGHDGVVVNVIDSTGRKKNGFEKMVIDAEDIWNPETLRALHEKTRPRSTFYDSLDVPKEDLIIRNGDGKAMSVEESVKRMKAIREGDERYFDSDVDKVARERFDLPSLKKISSGGSDRDVYDLGDGHVLKVAKTARGLRQNQAENDWYASSEGLIPKTKESGLNYVVAEKVNPPDAATKAMVREMHDKFGYSDFEKRTPELQDFLEKHGLSDILNYDILTGDYTALRNWGTTADGKPIHVDGGTLLGRQFIEDFRGTKNLDDADFRDAYNRSRAAKKKYGDTDKHTMYSIDPSEGKAMSIEPKTKEQIQEHTRQMMLKREKGRFIPSNADLPENASGSLKRKVQIANKDADRKINSLVNDEAARRQYEDGTIGLSTEDLNRPSVREAVRMAGGISSSDWEGLPSTVKNKSGTSLDEMVTKLNHEQGFHFQDGDDLANALIDDVGATKPALSTRQARKDAMESLGGGEEISKIDADRLRAIQVAVKEANTHKINVRQAPGKNVTEYVAAHYKDDASGREITELLPLDHKKHTLKNGTVVDKNGKSVGSYVGIDESGNQYAYVEGKPVNIGAILGDIDKWGNLNKAFTDMDRLIEQNAPDKATARKVQEFTTIYKDAQESQMKTSIAQHRQQTHKLEQALLANKPKKVSKDELSKDMFMMMEKKVDMNAMRQKYGDAYIDKNVIPALRATRQMFDKILDETNTVLEKNGFDAIPRRDNYITHIQEDPTFWQKVGVGIQDLNPFGSSVSSDVNPGKVRGGIPDAIVGNTEQTSARRRWNPFAQERKGNAAKQDFFAAVDAYIEPMMFNQYMTPAASRARIVERAFRTYEKAKQIKLDQLADIVGMDEAKKLQPEVIRHKNYKEGRRGPLVLAWQEYGNALAGKTNRIDRIVMEAGEGGSKAMDAAVKAQGIVGASSIPGSASAALAQVLSVPQTIARDSAGSVLHAAKDMLSFEGKRAGANDPLRKSSFMRARYTDASTRRKTGMQKYTSAASRPMEAIERFTGELSWRSAYHEAVAKGQKGMDAIRTADLETKKTLAGRGIGDRPVNMNSKAVGLFTQFGLEVNNMRIQFFNDFTPAQKAKFMVAATALNTVYGAVTGQTPLPDFVKAGLDTYNDMADSSDDEKDSLKTNIEQGIQRTASQASKFIPGAPTVAGVFLNDYQREELFGDGSDLSRFGTPAASKVLQVGASVKKALEKGDVTDAVTEAISVAPTGAQIKRTIDGLGSVAKGYTESGSGRIQNTIDRSNPLNWIQGGLFGKYSLPGQKDAMDKGSSLGEKQSEIFKKLSGQSSDVAKQYFDGVMANRPDRDKSGNLNDTGSGNKANATDASVAAMEARATKEINIADGTWKEKDGVLVNKEGKVQRGHYKDVAAGLEKGSDAAYKAYILGYSLESGTKYGKTKEAKSGNSKLDSLLNAEAKNSKSGLAGSAMDLFVNKGDKKDIPDWVKNRFYKEAGYTKEQVEYGAYTRLKAETRLSGIYRPMAQQVDHETFINNLANGRRQSINNKYMMVQDSMLTSLRDEGLISKEEAKYLKGLKLDWDGNVTKGAKSTARAKGAASSKKASAAAASAYLDAAKAGFAINAPKIANRTSGTSANTKLQMKQSNIQRKTASRGGSKTAKVSVRRGDRR